VTADGASNGETAAGRLVVDAGWILEPQGTWRRDAALGIEDGRVAAIANAAELEAWEGARHVGDRRTIALPGLVNAHHHGRARSSVGLGVRDDVLELWAADLLGAAWSDPYAETMALCRMLATTGTTSVMHVHSTGAGAAEVYELELRETLRAYRDAGIAAVVVADLRDMGVPVYAGESAFLASLPDALREAVSRAATPTPTHPQMLAAVRAVRADASAGAYGRGDVALGPVGQQWCSSELMAAVASVAAQDDMLVHTHLLQTPIDRELGRRRYDGGVVAHLRRLGLLSPRLSCAHAVLVDEDETDALARAGASIVINPSSCLRVLRGVAPLARLQVHGVNVALGTDSMSFAGREDMFDEARLLMGLAQFGGRRRDAVSGMDALHMLTRGGAQVLGRDDVGALRVGARADVLLLRADGLGPAVDRVDLAEAVVAAAGPDCISDVIAGGRFLVREGRCTVPEVVASYVEPDADRLRMMRELRPRVASHYRAWLEEERATRSREPHLHSDDESSS
jgi:5-methylthioadenosine/S-adenosylhomocysteine deaminase